MIFVTGRALRRSSLPVLLSANDELIKKQERACKIIRLLSAANGVSDRQSKARRVKYDVYAPQIIHEDRPNETGDASQKNRSPGRRRPKDARRRVGIRRRASDGVAPRATGTRASRNGSCMWLRILSFSLLECVLDLIGAYDERIMCHRGRRKS